MTLFGLLAYVPDGCRGPEISFSSQQVISLYP